MKHSQKLFVTLITFGGFFLLFIMLKHDSDSSVEHTLNSSELIKSTSIFSENLSSIKPEEFTKLDLLMPSLLVPDGVYFLIATSKKNQL